MKACFYFPGGAFYESGLQRDVSVLCVIVLFMLHLQSVFEQ